MSSLSEAYPKQITWVSGMPRSGTTWLGQIFASSPEVRLKNCPLFSYEFKNRLDETSSAQDWEQLLYEVYHKNSEFLNQEHLRKKGLILSFEKKHASPQHLVIKSNRFHHLTPCLLKLNKRICVIHIVRHPCAAICSWLNDPEEFPQGADPLKEWRTGECRKKGVGEFWGFDDWKKVTTQALRLSEQYPERHTLIRYESLQKNAVLCIQQLFKQLDLPYTEQTDAFIKLSQTTHDDRKHAVFKHPDRMTHWEKTLDPGIALQCIEELNHTELAQFLE